MNPILVEIFRARANALCAEASALGALDHEGVVGSAREILLRNLIAPLVPPEIEALTGSIINSHNGTRIERNQDDVVFFNHLRAPLLWAGAGCALIPIEGVVAQIEVKSTLKAGDIRSALAAAAELARISVKSAPIGLVFAYKSDLAGTGKSELDRLMESLAAVRGGEPLRKGQASSPVQALCVVGKGCWLLLEHPDSKKQGWFKVAPTEHREILSFASVVSNSLYSSHQTSGAGAYLLDPGWLGDPVVECPVLNQ